ncbi:DUF456 family protein [Sporomusa sp.]|uniref:DUF456 family protein n=1 Tax=Sporomusa sp. TaxID=2078658 RepID=UPI002BDDEA08|nr:DUF456 family protein [Sporomusa sp.]HWR45359.1 DUF456 family protein [Sporomusa sp.]
MLAKFIVTYIMLVGLLCTVSVKLPGTLIILLGAALYGAFTGFLTFTPWITEVLVFLVVAAELGGRALRIYLTRNYSVSRVFSVNSTISHLAGMLASDALLGPILGLAFWELLAGKTILPRSDGVLRVIFRLAGVAALRFVCGIVMIVLINMYIFM